MGDVVYSRKGENNIPSFWTVGRVMGLELRRDRIPKRAEDKFVFPANPLLRSR